MKIPVRCSVTLCSSDGMSEYIPYTAPPCGLRDHTQTQTCSDLEQEIFDLRIWILLLLLLNPRISKSVWDDIFSHQIKYRLKQVCVCVSTVPCLILMLMSDWCQSSLLVDAAGCCGVCVPVYDELSNIWVKISARLWLFYWCWIFLPVLSVGPSEFSRVAFTAQMNQDSCVCLTRWLFIYLTADIYSLRLRLSRTESTDTEIRPFSSTIFTKLFIQKEKYLKIKLAHCTPWCPPTRTICCRASLGASLSDNTPQTGDS